MEVNDYNNARVRVSDENRVTINGEVRNFNVGATLLDVVRSLGLEPERVAVELNRTIVKRDLWTSTLVDAGAEIEIVQFVGGG
jgi:thiamine biosynthesis protein ThiS